ncbi:MAG: hypothetical protein KJN60_10155 [Boseongicola sp.]|nr:hypothetical protein [Boseongicola sp.]
MFNLSDLIDRQRGYLFPWAPVMLGAGIGLYFSILIERKPHCVGLRAIDIYNPPLDRAVVSK